MAKAGFHKGSSGSPFQTEYYGNQGMDTGPGGKPSDEMPRVGAGVMGKRVGTEWTRGKKGGNSTGGDED